MADVRKEQERDELHRAIWAIADELRGSVDGWDFKSYVLGIMFYRYISENLTNYINEGEIESGNDGFDYFCCLTKMQNRLVRIWYRQKVSSFFRLSFSAMSERKQQMTKI